MSDRREAKQRAMVELLERRARLRAEIGDLAVGTPVQAALASLVMLDFQIAAVRAWAGFLNGGDDER